jgi:hypothetical protein
MSDASITPGSVFLDRFFASPNRLHAASKPELAHWVERVTRRELLPSVLPCWRPDGRVDWYGLAFDARQLRALGESLTAFVGPSYTTFRGRLAELDTSDPIEASVAEFTSGRAYKFRGEDARAIWAALERMRRGWERMGPRQRAAPAPVGRVLRDFHMAIRAGLEDEALSTIVLLRDEYHVDGLNVLFLRIELLASFGRWDDLLSLPESLDLIHLRRPAAVTEALLQAVYNRHLARLEETLDAVGALESFRKDVDPAYSPLLATRSGMHFAEVAKLFMLRVVSSSPLDVALRDELLAWEALSEYDAAYLRLISSLAGVASDTAEVFDPLSVAVEAADRSDFDRAFALARQAAPSIARTRILCECAFELGTLEARAEAIAAVHSLGEGEREAFLGRRVNLRLLEALEAPAGEASVDIGPVPTDWCSWVEHVDLHEGRQGSREIARRGASEWSVTEFIRKEGGVTRLVQLLSGSHSQEAERALRDSLPHLLAFFQGDAASPHVEFGEVYRLLLDLLFYSTEGGRADLVVFNDLLEARLSLGVGGAEQYRELGSYARDLWARYAAPATLDWAIDCLGILALHPCPDNEARRSVLQDVLDRAVGFERHVAAEQRVLLRLVAMDLGDESLATRYFPAAAVEGRTDDPFRALEYKSVAVYTLTEGAGRRFQEVLEARVPTVRVTLAHDRVASARLRQLARQTDIFLVATGSAKHAATDCIEDARPRELPTLRPGGRGAASLLRAIRDYLVSG